MRSVILVMTPMHEEDMKKFISHMISLSKESKAISQATMKWLEIKEGKMVLAFTVVRGLLKTEFKFH